MVGNVVTHLSALGVPTETKGIATYFNYTTKVNYEQMRKFIFLVSQGTPGWINTMGWFSVYSMLRNVYKRTKLKSSMPNATALTVMDSIESSKICTS